MVKYLIMGIWGCFVTLGSVKASEISFAEAAQGYFADPETPIGSDSVDIWQHFPALLKTRSDGSTAWGVRVESERISAPSSDSSFGFLDSGYVVAYMADGTSILSLFQRDSATGELAQIWHSDRVRGDLGHCWAIHMDSLGGPELVTVFIDKGARWWYPNVLIYDVSPNGVKLLSPMSTNEGFSVLSGRDLRIKKDDGRVRIETSDKRTSAVDSLGHSYTETVLTTFRIENGKTVIDSSSEPDGR